MTRLNFQLEAEATGSKARATTFTTLHGVVKTPIFMPVGTQATVKSQTVESLKEVGSNVLLANTYHLMLRPGPEVFKKFGGIHRFMNWDRPVLTDSGGFQIFSLPHSRQMNEDGAHFQSYVDGKMHMLSPEVSIEMQRAIGSDIMMVLDQCIPSTAEHAQAKLAMELTHRWAKRSLAARGDSLQSMFGIVQGACYQDLRKQSADFLTQLPFDGFAVGGLAVGESKQEREDFTEITTSYLPKNLPRYLMGVGTPSDILEAVHRGIDMFDCILPGQLAQRGVAFTSKGKFQLRRSVYKFSEEKLDPNCSCSTCKTYSRAYLHHLNKADEVLGWHLIAYHNLYFYHQLMREIRESILADTFLRYYREKQPVLALTDEENPSTPVALPKLSKKERARKLGDYEVHDSGKGFSSIRHMPSGEIMHSVTEPAEEARNLYVQPTYLAERLKQKKKLVVWDVGLGAASNAMALLEEAGLKNNFQDFLTANHGENSIEMISFENNFDPLKLALKHPWLFPHLQHAAPNTLLEEGKWESAEGKIQWSLLSGDFVETFSKAPIPDVIYYDLYSSKTHFDAWQISTMQKLYDYLKGNRVKFMTYTASTAVRAAFLSIGFFVGAGPSSGPKSDTTVIYTDETEARESNTLLGQEWLTRWKRSGTQFPENLTAEQKAEFEKKILEHPQFASL